MSYKLIAGDIPAFSPAPAPARGRGEGKAHKAALSRMFFGILVSVIISLLHPPNDQEIAPDIHSITMMARSSGGVVSDFMMEAFNSTRPLAPPREVRSAFSLSVPTQYGYTVRIHRLAGPPTASGQSSTSVGITRDGSEVINLHASRRTPLMKVKMSMEVTRGFISRRKRKCGPSGQPAKEEVSLPPGGLHSTEQLVAGRKDLDLIRWRAV